MQTQKKRTKVVVSVLVLAGLVVFALSAIAGNLEPSAPPGPTMKTLDEVEPRTPISSVPYTISSPGSYYLIGDLQIDPCAPANGITVEANNVTIDLSGFTLIGPGPDSGTNYGIYMCGPSNVEIRNGTVRDFGYDGIYECGWTGKRKPHRIIAVRSVFNGRHGIYLGGLDHLIKGCTASDNGTSATGDVRGISAGDGCTVTGNTASLNGYSATGDVRGISAGYGCTVTGNTAHDNGRGATGSTVHGICAGSGSTVTGNTAYYNGSPATSTVYGIRAGQGSTVTSNTAYRNGDSADGTVYGIYARQGSTVTGNTAGYNGMLAAGSICGICAGSGSTVTGNTAYDNGLSATGSYVYGIAADPGCTVTGNTAYDNISGDAGTVYGIYLGGNNLVDQNTAYHNSGTNMDTTLANCTYGTNHAP